MVAHDGAAWLPRTLAALASQSRRPDDVVGVDTGSADDSGTRLTACLDRVVHAAAGCTFGDAVRAGITARDVDGLAPVEDPHSGGRSAEPGEPAPQEWLWLLHDDSAPAPDALERLLAAVEVAPSVAIAGCKQRSWDDPSRLLQTGFTTSRLGRPITGVEAGDVDQGQTDDREDVLAVGSAGMLVRRDVWERLGSGDPAVPVVGDDLDLCRRARLAGHRVVVVPGAVVHHVDATRAGRRPTGPAGRRSLAWVTRRGAVHARLTAAPAPLLPLTVLAVLLGGLGRAVLRTAATQPARAGTELGAVLAALARPDRVWRARRAAARTRAVPRRVLYPLLAGRRDVARWHRDRWQRRRATRRAALGTLAPRPVTPGGLRLPAAVVLALLVVSGLALHRLVGPGAVLGGALAPAPDTLGRLWASARSSWVAAGLGTAGPADPFLTVLTVLALPFGGQPGLAVTALLLLAVPLSGLGAWVAAGAATSSAWLRGWAALAWAAAPPLLYALDGGRLGPALAHAALPWVGLAVAATLTALSLRRAWTAAAAGGLALAVAAACAPVLLPAAVVALLVLAAGVARRVGRRALALVWVPLPALVLCGPLLLAAVGQPRVLFADPGLPLFSEAAPAWQVLLGQPAAVPAWPLLPPAAALPVALACSGVVAVVAALALARGGGRGIAVRCGWAVAVVGLLAAVAAAHVVVGVDATGTVPGWAGAATSLLLAGLLAAALAGADGAGSGIGGHRFGWRQATAGLLTGLALLGPALSLGAWTVRQLDGGAAAVVRAAPVGLPAVAADGARSSDRTRTLVLRAGTDGTLTATVARRDGERLDASSALGQARALTGGLTDAVPAASDPAQSALDEAVARLVGGTVDPRPALADLGIGYVLLLDPAEDAAGAVVDVSSLDAVLGLTRAGEVASGVLWRVSPASGDGPVAVDRSARLRILDGEGRPLAVLPSQRVDAAATVPAGKPGRLLVLAERADAGWSATLNGRALAPAVHAGWAQAFALPADGGRLVLSHDAPGADAWTLAQLVIVGLTVLLALPVGASVRRGAPR